MMVRRHRAPRTATWSVGGTNNGMVAMFVRFLGLTSHAGGAPTQGINAVRGPPGAGRSTLWRETSRDE